MSNTLAGASTLQQRQHMGQAAPPEQGPQNALAHLAEQYNELAGRYGKILAAMIELNNRMRTRGESQGRGQEVKQPSQPDLLGRFEDPARELNLIAFGMEQEMSRLAQLIIGN